MFTLNNTYNEVVHGPFEESFRMLIGKLMFSEDTILSFVPEEAHEKTFQEISEIVSMPWGGPFPSREIIDAANLAEEIFGEKKWEIFSLWEENKAPVFNNTKDDVCLFTPVMAEGDKRPAVILCPGGAYETLAMVGEGFNMAKEYMARGYRPFILRYRRKPSSFPAEQMDLTLALLYVKANARTYGVDPDDVTITGFSAGAHLCSSTTTHMADMKKLVLAELADPSRAEAYADIDPMPGHMVLGYGLSVLEELSFDGLCTEEELPYYKPHLNVSADLPETYAFACQDDTLVNYKNTVILAEAMQNAGVSVKYHIYPTGGHGISTGKGTSAEGWMDEMFRFFAQEEK